MIWLYRVLENDDEGDPLDFGVVEASTFDEAQKKVTAHLVEIHGDFDQTVRFYKITGQVDVWATDDPYVDVNLEGEEK